MDLQIKVFRWPNQANHIIMLPRGILDIDGLKQIFRKIAEMSAPLLDCKILIDLLSAKCAIEAVEIDNIFKGIDSEYLSHTSKIAVVFARAHRHYEHVATMSATLSKQGFKVAVFDDPDAAAEWLVNIP